MTFQGNLEHVDENAAAEHSKEGPHLLMVTLNDTAQCSLLRE